ncbi:MAG TPA: hypothetical protein VHR97_01610, partial [Candidatus Baltobacteraceae bacterium]|nr:hypothetical protein [Candidatus Baltobacteraceae bacterium]
AALERKFQESSATKDIQELRAIVRRPGWKTLVEQSLFLAIVEALDAQVEAVARMRTSLLEAAKQIGPIAKPPHQANGPGDE